MAAKAITTFDVFLILNLHIFLCVLTEGIALYVMYTLFFGFISLWLGRPDKLPSYLAWSCYLDLSFPDKVQWFVWNFPPKTSILYVYWHKLWLAFLSSQVILCTFVSCFPNLDNLSRMPFCVTCIIIIFHVFYARA